MALDLFSAQAKTYAQYRPHYPEELFEYILQFVNEKSLALDCATGNGQAAVALSKFFKQVFAIDISEAQLQNADQQSNIQYSVAAAEHTNFAHDSFDLITVATAYHWFNTEAFYKEATRIGKNGAVVAAWSYNLLLAEDEKINDIIQHFYHQTTAAYWNKERKFVDEAYETIHFDFEPLPSKNFEMKFEWTKQAFLGYLSSWSAVQHYIKQNGTSPIALIENELVDLWPAGEEKTFVFPLFLKIGRVRK